MAGRGTDIKLGGDPEALAAEEANPEVDEAAYDKALERFVVQTQAERQEVLKAGGLFIVGTERHESRRVDNQLRGRSGRQGDPGGSRFYLSLEDHLLRIFGSDKVTVWMERMGLEDDEPIEHRWITSAVENAQIKVEGHNFNIRKNLLEYDDVMNYQRKGVYEIRRRALAGENVVEMVEEAVGNIVQDMMDDFVVDGLRPEHWNLPGLRENLKRVFELEWEESDDALRDFSRVEIRDRIRDGGLEKINAVREAMGEDVYVEYARMLLLQYTDNLWKDHLLALDRLRQGVGLRGYGQRNPLLEYKREALQMYLMMAAMRDEMVVTQLVHTELEQAQAAAEAPSKRTARRLVGGNFKPADQVFAEPTPAPAAAPEPAIAEPMTAPQPGDEARLFAHRFSLRRNDPCPCGSGKKYKRCCYDPAWKAPVDESPSPAPEASPPATK